MGVPPSGAGREAGYTLIELTTVLALLTTVITALLALFVSGARAELEQNRRFQAQQEARIATDRMRRELHCASGVTVNSATSINVTIPGHCPAAVGGATTVITYSTETVGASRFRLKRQATAIADYLTRGNVFSYVPPSPDSLGKLHLDLSVNVNPNEGWKTWRLQTDIVLRNTVRQ